MHTSSNNCSDSLDLLKLREIDNIHLPASHYIDSTILKHQIYDIFDPSVIKEHFFNEGSLTLEQTTEILHTSMDILTKEPNLLIINSPVTIIGDIHGQFYDLCNMIARYDFTQDTLVFLGDYVDRGAFSIEVYLYLLSLKIAYPNNIYLLRGNHESEKMSTYFTFKTECIHKYNEDMYKIFVKSFYTLPLVAICCKFFYCAHGGISPDIDYVNEINDINRFREPPFSGTYCDILWSDPHPRFNMQKDYSMNTQRNCSFFFSQKAARKFLIRNNLKCIIRGHEVQSDGYKLYTDPNDGFTSVITIFSAPNYCDVYQNKGAVMHYDGESTTILKYSSVPHPFYLNNYLESINWSFPFVCEKASEFFLGIVKYLKEELGEDLVEKTEVFTEAMVLMRNEREGLTELNDEESTELPSCSLKNIETNLTFEEAKEMDKINEKSKNNDTICEGLTVDVSPSCTNELTKMLEAVDLKDETKEKNINLDDSKELKNVSKKKGKKTKKKMVLSEKNKK